MKLIMRFLLVAVLALLVWRVVALGVSQHYADRLREGDRSAAERALAWSAAEPTAELSVAKAQSKEQPAEASARIAAVYAANPASARPLLALASLAESGGDTDRAKRLLGMAVKLHRVDATVLKQAAAFWTRQGDLGQALAYWSTALEANPAAEQAALFPVFLAVAEDPGARALLAPLAAAPPGWWDSFFGHMARRALSLETVRAIYAMRRGQADAPLSELERAAYIRRLQKDDQMTEAYLVWVNGLDEARRSQLGILNNGGFELEPSNLGFDWHVASTDHVDVSTAKTFGVVGQRALYLLFKGRDKAYGHIHQPLFLDPAFYRLTGRVRTDSLSTVGGLKWVVRCLKPEVQVLGETGRFLGTSEWTDFSVDFQVLDTCTSQEVRLVSAGQRAFEQKITGGIWMDAMALRKIPKPEPSAVGAAAAAP